MCICWAVRSFTELACWCPNWMAIGWWMMVVCGGAFGATLVCLAIWKMTEP